MAEVLSRKCSTERYIFNARTRVTRTFAGSCLGITFPASFNPILASDPSQYYGSAYAAQTTPLGQQQQQAAPGTAVAYGQTTWPAGYAIDASAYAQYYNQQYYQQSQTAVEIPPGVSTSTPSYSTAAPFYQQPYTHTPQYAYATPSVTAYGSHGYDWSAWYAQNPQQQQQQQQQHSSIQHPTVYAAAPTVSSTLAAHPPQNMISSTSSTSAPFTSTQPAVTQKMAYADVVKGSSTTAAKPSAFGAAKPAYITVKPRKVLAESPLVSQSKDDEPSSKPRASSSKQESQDPNKWPPSLKEYVTKVFDTCPADKRDIAEKQIKDLIVQTMQNNVIWTTDWTNMALPSYCQQPEPKAKQRINIVSTPSPPASPSISKKRKEIPQSPAESRQSTKMATVTVSTSSNVSSDDEDVMLARLPPSLRKAELERRQQRKERFKAREEEERRKNLEKQREIQRAKEAFLRAGAEGNPDVIDWDEYTIVGTCTDLEKRYLRLTSAPDPASVRPLHILRQTLDLLISKWKKEQNYTFICDQFKSLRQDLTVQRIKNEFTVAVYETHARIALEKGDLGEYNQCQAQLMQLYNIFNLRGCQDEFTGYRILYLVHTSNRTELVKVLGELTDEQKNGEIVKHALNVRTAVAIGDYHRFFLMYGAAPRLSAYLMDHFAERERIRALKIICRAYRPGISLDYIATELGFVHADDVSENDVDAIRLGRKACTKWLKEQGVQWVNGEVGRTVDTKGSLPVLQGLFDAISRKGVDIKGQIH
ncbi:uncharacterized protein SPPG_09089 [Spizellomyces punctatus DAOM BR117]|uniref:PCI domain-containing protein n=1 Tax=Spizellomyces punctatus (strain DAOM BR117) TaxID=645134 RepID=A0A0L0HKG2_SPIPD|nr:uncharacterized protein SPPG_09089 [Spizellomyces punctatus DAOM BR117]KND01324.1 hypothetical protein SPPG_09089 [Spizellomyces punctatus DAOM BR117]|eukprot:XP_016609363.1 hypothetical protein SPPG_09089 [Spizellomyces punctatus DAOM BR117]